VFLVSVVCRNDASAVDVDVYVNSTVEGTNASQPDTPHIADMAEFHALWAAASFDDEVDTIPIDHGNPPESVPPALWR
jgi:hypothetical protein